MYREFADFVVCTFPNDKPTFYIERVEVDSDFLANCIMKSGDFYKAGWHHARIVGQMVYQKY